jgi:hypothetical protein
MTSMNRKWRVGRVVVAAVLFATAGLMGWWWRTGPLWRIPATNVLGFDVRQNVLFTMSDAKPVAHHPGTNGVVFSRPGADWPVVVVTARDLATGQVRSTSAISGEAVGAETYSRGAALAPGGTLLALWSAGGSVVEVFSLPEGRRLGQFRTPGAGDDEADRDRRKVHSLAFSPDGSLLAASTRLSVVVWELSSGKVLQQSSLRAGPFSGLSLQPDSGEIDFSPDGRFLAATNVPCDVHVIEVSTGRVVGIVKDAVHPRFLAHNLVASRAIFYPGQASVHEVFEGNLCKIRGPTAGPEVVAGKVSEGPMQDAGPVGVLTVKRHASDPTTLPEWLPAGTRQWLRGAMGQDREWWDLSLRVGRTGEEGLRVPIDVHERQRRGISFDVRVGIPGDYPTFSATLSKDGRWVAIQDTNSVSVWEISSRRPLSCYLTCSCLLLLALWLAWPRKAKAAATPAS